MDKKVIFVVEGHETMRVVLCKMLEDSNSLIFSAENGAEGLKLFENAYPDVIFCGLRMPEMNGREFLEKVKKLAPLVPVIMMSGLCSDGTAKELMGKGAKEVLQKPFDLETLKKSCERAVKIA